MCQVPVAHMKCLGGSRVVCTLQRSVIDCELVDDVQVLDHFGKLLEANFAIHVFISLDDSSVNELLKLDIVQIATNHHFEHLEQFSVRNIPVIVNIIDLESESELFLLRRSS